VFFWIILGAAVAGLVVAGVSDLRRAHRESPRARPPGITAAGYLERARAAAELASRAQRERAAADHRPDVAVAADRPDVAAQERRHRERPRTVEELVYRRADPLDRSREAFNLGVALHKRGDVRGAVSAYWRAERQGDPDASFNLGVLMRDAGELDAAEAWWRRSWSRGNSRATEDLGVLVRRRRERQTAGPEREGADR
jgi:TPR repeat protein